MGLSLKEHFRRCRCRMVAEWNNEPFEHYRIHCDDSECLRVERRDIYGETEFQTLQWEKINLVWVYKLDMFIGDRICIMMVISKTETFTINEDMEGWRELMKILPGRLLGIKVDWWTEVCFPPYETNLSLIYRNPAADQTELDEIIKDYEAEPEAPRPKPYWEFLYLTLLLLTFPWPLVGLTIFCIPRVLFGILLMINLTSFIMLVSRIFAYWEIYFPKIWICRTLQIIAISCLISYYIIPFLLQNYR